MTDYWDYTNRAATYDARAAYSRAALDKLIRAMGCKPWEPVADIGAGTGKLTVPLLDRNLTVIAIEPNDAMRELGIRNTMGRAVSWAKADMHHTGIDDSSVAHAFFGSSFNVADQQVTLKEVARILKQGGSFACMWNHRDLSDPLQAEIESIFKREVPNYNYGKRRENPTADIEKSKLFGPINHIEERFLATLPAQDWVSAWSSHATVARQVGEQKMAEIVNEIGRLVGDAKDVTVPYTTVIWYAQCVVEKTDWRTAASRESV
jgi:ubiquinone/menaquinone biosynthesis C-methylase UbiE